ncbi:hypothetical protein GE09DRAFT_1288642 [Coniochaeta sp. 2T2.1]|nr:hypothetical protein GE09DRAFT_1288642 [Coniochaeta sp. 2T2.1]
MVSFVLGAVLTVSTLQVSLTPHIFPAYAPQKSYSGQRQGQLDNNPILNNPNINALFTAGYPSQSGGQAIIDVITGVAAPATRLPETQYPSSYLNQRYECRRYDRWYTGEPTLPFGYSLHYTNFTVSVAAGSNGTAASSKLARGDAVFAINDLFGAGHHGPAPRPIKTLVPYGRAHNITAGSSTRLTSSVVTLGSRGRVDEQGDTWLCPGNYSFIVDIEPRATVNFTLTGDKMLLDQWPTPPPNGHPSGVEFISDDYYLGEMGSVRADTS